MGRQKKEMPSVAIPACTDVRTQFDNHLKPFVLGLEADARDIEAEIEALEDQGIKPLDYLASANSQRLNSLFCHTNLFNSRHVVLLLQHRDLQLRIARLSKVYDDEAVFMDFFGSFLGVQLGPLRESLCQHFWELFRNT